MKRAVIIGGGVAGLSAGIFGTLLGYECHLFEKNPHPGGQLTGWKRGDYLIDNCMHWLNGTHPRDPMYATWQQLGMLCGEMPLWRPSVFYASEWKGIRLEMGRDLQKTKQQMLALSPVDKKEIERLTDAVERVGKSMLVATEPMVGRLLHVSNTAMAYASSWLRYGRMTTRELSECFCHPLLRAMLTDFIGGPFSALAWIFAYAAFTVGDADLPAGGSYAAAARMTQRFLSVGGRLHTSAPVARILLSGGRAVGVETVSGEVYEADHVICATDPAVTFGRLLPRQYMPRKLQQAFSRPDRYVRYSAIHAAFACPAECAPAAHTLIFDLPSCVEVPAGLAEDALSPASPPYGRMAIKVYTHEKGFAPKGMCVLQVLQFLPWERARAWVGLRHRPDEYRRAKQRYALLCMEALEKKFSLTGKLQPLDVWTPATYERYTGANDGGFLGFVLSPNNLLYRLSPKMPELENVWLATQWQRAPGGLPVAALAGKRAARAMAAADEPRRVPLRAPANVRVSR